MREGSVEVAECRALLDVGFSHNLTEVVGDATRRYSNLGSVLDLIFISKQLAGQINPK